MMTYRMNAGDKCSILGFGCMRFPLTADGKIDEPVATSMIDRALEAGVNYFDTAWNYHGGESETFVGKALVARHPRDSFFLATKLPVFAVESADHAREIFEKQLQKLGTDHIDFYLLHALNRRTFVEKVQGMGLLNLCEEWKKQGKIRHIGFSFHDDYDAFEEILCAYNWDFCQIQYNYMDTAHQAGDRGVDLCARRNVPIVVMEPIRGGNLVHFPDDIKSAFSAVDPTRNLANWALSWVATHTQVKVVLSGMSTPTQLKDNLRTMSNFRPLSSSEMHEVSKIADRVRASVRVPCTGCRYCMPCPGGVNIPRVFHVANEEAMHGSTAFFRRRYMTIDPSARASACVGCGACLEKCPQHIDVPAKMQEVTALFGK